MRITPLPLRCGKLYVFLWMISTAFWMVKGKSNMSEEHSHPIVFLFEQLMRKYPNQQAIRPLPVHNQSETIQLKFGISLLQILELDEKSQVLTTLMRLNYVWRDHFLTWPKQSDDRLNTVRVVPGKIWTPDIILYNAVDAAKETSKSDYTLYSDGTVSWYPQFILKSSCTVDIQRFPFDTQTCIFKFGSTNYHGFLLDIGFYESMEEIDLSDFILSNSWNVLDHRARKNVKYYPCCSEPHPDLTFMLTIRRISGFLVVVLLLPCMLLSSLTVVVFLLPPNSGEKISLGITIVLSYFMLLLIIVGIIPQSAASFPILGTYIAMNMIVNTVSVFCSCLVLKLSCRSSAMPGWMQMICNRGIGKLLLVCPKRQQEGTRGSNAELSMDTYVGNNVTQNTNLKQHTSLHSKHKPRCEMQMLELRRICKRMDTIAEILKSNETRVTENTRKKQCASQWYTLAAMLDRFFLLSYIAFAIYELVELFEL